MDHQQLWAALRILLTARTKGEFDELSFRQPELFEEEVLRSIRALSLGARKQGDAHTAAVLEELAMMLGSTAEALKDTGIDLLRMEPVTPKNSIIWARLTRDYLARRQVESLDKATRAARRAGEKKVVALLRCFENEEPPQIDPLVDNLFRTFNKAGRIEEALTIAILGLDFRASMARRFMHWAAELQTEALNVGLQSCQLCVTFSRILGDYACQAFYLVVQGIGHAALRDLNEAEAAYEEALEKYRVLGTQQPQVYESDVVMTLNNLGNVRRDLRKLIEAEATFEEALEKCRDLAVQQPRAYESHVAATLNNLGLARNDLHKLTEAEAAYEEALKKYRKLVKQQPSVYESGVATTLNNLGNVRSQLRRLTEAEGAYEEALRIRRKLAEKHPRVYGSDVAMTLNNLGSVQRELRKLPEAEAAFEEALREYRELAAHGPQIYESHVAMTLNNLGGVQIELHKLTEAEIVLEEALEKARELAKNEPQVYRHYLAEILNSIGNVRRELRNLGGAESAFEEALRIRRALAAHQPQVYSLGLVMTLNNLGTVLRGLRKLTKAETVLEEALKRCRKLSARQPQAYEAYVVTTLNNLGLVQDDLRKLAKAEASFEEALEKSRELAKSEPRAYELQIATMLNNLGNVQGGLLKLAEAEAAYEEALKKYRDLATQQPEVYDFYVAMSLNNLGIARRAQRKLTEAEAAYEEALGIRRRLALRQPQIHTFDVAMTLNNLGIVRSDLHKLIEAEAAHEEALEIRRALEEKQPQVHKSYVAMTLINLGNVRNELRKFTEAQATFEEALEKSRELADEEPQAYGPSVAMTLNNLANVLRGLQKLTEAEATCEEALEMYRVLAEQQPQVYEFYVATTLINLGNVRSELPNLTGAQAAFEEALELSLRSDLPVERKGALRGLGQLAMIRTEWGEAERLLQGAVVEVERLRTEGQSLLRRGQVLRENVGIYERLLVCLLKQGKKEEAFVVTEQGKSRAINDLFATREVRPKDEKLAKERDDFLVKAHQLEDVESALVMRLEKAKSTHQNRIAFRRELELLRRERVKVNEALEDLGREIQRAEPDFLPYARTLSFEEIKRLAHATAATLLLFRVTEFGSFVFLVFPDGETDVVEVHAFKADSLSEMLVKFGNDKPVSGWSWLYYQSRMDAWMEFIVGALNRLYRELVEPVHQRLRDNRQHMKTSNRLVIVPDRGLAILPLHACWWKENDETKYLLDEYVCTYAPSLYILNGSVSHKRELDPQDKLFGLANPNHDDAELRLAFSEWECQEIERLFGSNHCSIRLREQATKGSLLAQAPDFQLLHFSCHAKYELGAPFQSALLLADAMMNTGEIMSQLNLRHTWLTVLSACETSLGDFRDRTNEQYGLPLGFLVAGTPTVWGTLWSVNDLSTALLIKRAYQNLKDGMSKPEALHSAQIALRDMTASNVCEALEETPIGLGSASKLRFGLEDQNQVNMWKKSIKHNEKPFAHPYHWAGMQCIGV